MDLSKLKGTFGFTAKESMKFEKSYQSWHQTLGPGVLLIPLLIAHPWAGEDLSLKIDEHDQTIWNCILES